MSKNERSFIAAIESGARGVCIELLQGSPDLTVREIQQLCRGEYGPILATITLGELTGSSKGEDTTKVARPEAPEVQARKANKAKPSKTKRPKASAPKAKPTADNASESQARPVEVNTRTSDMREAFDAKVFAAVQAAGGPVGAGEIQKQTGGTNMQVRAACNRLIEADRLSWSGKARGTRYFLA